MATPRIQEWIHKLEVGGGARALQYIMLAVLVVGQVFVYDLRAYRGFTAPEAMDAFWMPFSAPYFAAASSYILRR